ncbi:putative neurobeachin/beige protein [Trypanosoma conorhini]|uniref:Putative neurobeachin/beige protein n=1 Tax=Trypanosoma conorhini TaxID=83891 RepID=A0A422Q9P1_9TRYP|nr:putative neurobeachin/beige protein [Trypanosoma conorhini]RNF26681.1 putative neurobeachin/beige protein [Trypanosoma conorhini]
MFRFFTTIKKLDGGHADTTERVGERDEAAVAAEFTRFLSLPSTEGIRSEIERLDSRCGSSSYVYPYSSDTGLEASVLALLDGASPQPALPARLLTLLLQRLEYACAHVEEEEVADFLQVSLTALHALLLTDEARFGPMMLALGLDDHLLLVLQFVRTNVMSRISAWTKTTTAAAPTPSTAIPPEDLSEPPYDSGTRYFPNATLQPHLMRRGAMLRILRETMRLLLALHFTPAPTAAGVTGMSSHSLFMRGMIRYRADSTTLLPSTTTTTTTTTTQPLASPATEAAVGAASAAAAPLACSEGMLTECGHLFLCLSKGALDLSMPEEAAAATEEEREKEAEEGNVVAEVVCSLVLLMSRLYREPSEWVMHVTLAGIGVQLARFIVTKERGESLDLLRQLSSGLLLAAKLLKESPLLTIEAMSSVYFFDNLAGALQLVGRQYASARTDESYLRARADALQQLHSVTDLEAFRVRKLSEKVLHLPRPRFERLAEDATVDEFLHCYISLLETQRLVRTTVEVRRDPALLRVFAEIELTLIKALLDAPTSLAPESCMYEALMKYTIASLPLHDLGAVEMQRVTLIRPLINAGLYRILFHDQAFRAFRDDPRLYYAAVFLLHYMLTHRLSSLEDHVEEEVGITLDAFLNTDVEEASQEAQERTSLMCAILISAVYGPNAAHVLEALMQRNAISMFAAIANKASISNMRKQEAGEVGDGDAAGAGGSLGEWVTYLLTQLLRQPEVQQGVLLNQAEIAFSLLTVRDIRGNAEQMVVSLLSHRCVEAEYTQRMTPLVKCTWELVRQCVRIETEGSPVAAPIEADDEDHLLLSILYCIRASLQLLAVDLPCWGFVRQLQNALCGSVINTPDPFLCLLHRAILPWRGVRASHGLSCILQTIAMLVQGNPALRARLFQTMDAEQLVTCFQDAWFASRGGSWLDFVRLILLLVYEEVGDAQEGGAPSTSKRKSSTTALLAQLKEDAGIQNPELLSPLLRIFSKLSEFNKRHRDALEYLLARLLRTLKASLVSLWMLANAGVFEVLTALIPVVTGTALLEMVLSLIMNIASHHISVRETKQFLIGIAHTESEEERRRMVPIVTEVLNAASYMFLKQQTERQNYIAFRECSGPTGVKAILAEFPQDGYTVCMWVRMERRADWRMPQCIFSLQNIEKRTVLELVATLHGVSVVFQNAQKKTLELDLNCSIPPQTWTHLAVVHRQAAFPFSGSEFLCFLNGVEVAAVSRVHYPPLSLGFFYIGTRGEDVLQRSSRSSFTGQMTAVYFLLRPLPLKEVVEFFMGDTGVTSVKQYASQIAVYIDPRFGERGQVHNLATLMRSRASELPLITYEGTIACSTNSIIDSLCVLGALHTVVVPLLVLLVNPQLPFQCRVPPAKRKPVPEATRKAVDDLLKLVESLLLSNIVRADVLEVGLFPIIAHVLQQFVDYHCPNLAQRLGNMCNALLSNVAIFDAAYASLFLSGDLLQACSEATQLTLIKTQLAMCSINSELRQRVHALELPSFVVSEMIHVYNTLSGHHVAMRNELFALLEVTVVDPLTMNDADALLRLITAAVKQGESAILFGILERSRILIATRNPLLAAFMGKKNFAAILISLLTDSCAPVQTEALLLFCLLVSRSRRTQELLNPTLLSPREAVRVTSGISLSWLREALHAVPVGVELYTTLRAALTGRFDAPIKDCLELRREDKLLFAPALTPLLQIVKRSQETALKQRAMSDVAALLQQDPSAWKSLVSVSGWYASLVDSYLSEDVAQDEQTREESPLLASTKAIFVKVIFNALLHEAYGASELELFVAYLVQQRAHVLLNAVLLGVVKEYSALLSTRYHSFGAAHLGLGNQQAATNFTTFLFAIEDVMFYSATTYQTYGVARPVESIWKRGYTEEEELVLNPVKCHAHDSQQQPQAEAEEEAGAGEMSEGRSFAGGETLQLRIHPDGVWLHAALAVSTMYLITSRDAVLHSGGTNNGSTLDFSLRGRRFRKGGFLRFFVRLFRVTCNFTLRDGGQVEGILLVAERWVRAVEKEQSSFLLLRRQVTEQREHSSLSGSMIMVASLHDLLARRLRFSVEGASTLFEDLNHEILDRIKCLCILYRKTLFQMQIFQTERPSDESAPQTRMDTLAWLCSRRREGSIVEFVEVASRQDYDVFLRQCTLILERDRLTEKLMARLIEEEHGKVMGRLHRIITELSVARKQMLDALEQYMQEASTETEGAGTLTERFAPQTARTLAMVVFNAIWARFLERCKGTIWDFDPAGQHSTKYVRLSEVEQQQLVRRKFVFDANGTDHANISTMGSSPPVVQETGEGQTCPRGGKRTWVTTERSENDEEETKEGEEEDEEEELEEVAVLPLATEEQPTVHFSMACEVPYMMHCWSATIMIRESDLCIFFDDENKAYNQRIAQEAESLLLKPGSIIYPSGHVRMLAPGRRFRMQRSAVEIWFLDGRSVLINFTTIPDMRAAVSNISTAAERHKVPYLPLCIFHLNPKKDPRLWRCMGQWREREISNFDYLLWLNFFGGRTLNDLTQYPIFPWVIADYTSDELDLESSSTFRDLTLPVGVCGGPQSRTRVEMRYELTKQLGDAPAHYFTHYSSSAVVLYYLIRMEPFTTLQVILQGGHFDHADRMFHSIAACWHGVTTNSQDVREVIPELFYMPEICMNTNRVRFGCKQGGEAMDALELPPWSHGDPYEFIYRMREALESDYVSSMLHHWVDLIFGYKQRGKEAIAALNLFNWHSYEELDKSRGDDVDRQLLIDSLDNIGQTPIQLFTQPHVARRPRDVLDPVRCSLSVKTADVWRLCPCVARVALIASDRVLVVGGSGTALLFHLLLSPPAERAKRTSAAGSLAVAAAALGDVAVVISTGGGSSRPSSSADVLLELKRRTAPLPTGVVPNTSKRVGGPCETENVAVLSFDGEAFVAFGGLFDNTFVIRPLDSPSVFAEERLSAHRGRVIRIAASIDSRYIVSGAEDTTFIVWSCHLQQGRGRLRVELLFTVYGHEDNPTAVDLSPALDLVATASRDGVLMLHSLASSRLERSLRHPKKFAIDRVLIQSTCYLPNILYVSAVDHVIHQISINGVALRSVTAPGRITSWCTTPKQHILVTTVPFTNSNASEESGAMVHFLHGFYLALLKSVPCPSRSSCSTLTCCTVHPSNSQVIVCGSSEGFLCLLCLEP